MFPHVGRELLGYSGFPVAESENWPVLESHTIVSELADGSFENFSPQTFFFIYIE